MSSSNTPTNLRLPMASTPSWKPNWTAPERSPAPTPHPKMSLATRLVGTTALIAPSRTSSSSPRFKSKIPTPSPKPGTKSNANTKSKFKPKRDSRSSYTLSHLDRPSTLSLPSTLSPPSTISLPSTPSRTSPIPLQGPNIPSPVTAMTIEARLHILQGQAPTINEECNRIITSSTNSMAVEQETKILESILPAIRALEKDKEALKDENERLTLRVRELLEKGEMNDRRMKEMLECTDKAMETLELAREKGASHHTAHINAPIPSSYSFVHPTTRFPTTISTSSPEITLLHLPPEILEAVIVAFVVDDVELLFRFRAVYRTFARIADHRVLAKIPIKTVLQTQPLISRQSGHTAVISSVYVYQDPKVVRDTIQFIKESPRGLHSLPSLELPWS
ncbi:hypothetical protein K504DRAFT_537060 [Pleomassaria siparia CBS 279.74]|uniref:F-box domain-containing protein n=1 Tax=Pleomassaria siparia CBS 279.74 TaxID=1314801 RepID=A0A6G1JY43_9PLEO|nr:hypothetical protein K504DRAFT_537060 [Pleomassaria siparia CBS 279.74]